MSSQKILIVDDDKDLLLGLQVRLSSHGYTVLCASDAASAIQMAATKNPDLILLDLGLPDSNGFIVMEVVKQLISARNTPVIVVSARPFDVYKEASLLAGAKAYLQKPFDNEELLNAIQKELGASMRCLEDTRQADAKALIKLEKERIPHEQK
jgi:two-component system, OmpR family, KDP operon response regulator KdpE